VNRTSGEHGRLGLDGRVLTGSGVQAKGSDDLSAARKPTVGGQQVSDEKPIQYADADATGVRPRGQYEPWASPIHHRAVRERDSKRGGCRLTWVQVPSSTKTGGRGVVNRARQRHGQLTELSTEGLGDAVRGVQQIPERSQLLPGYLFEPYRWTVCPLPQIRCRAISRAQRARRLKAVMHPYRHPGHYCAGPSTHSPPAPYVVASAYPAYGYSSHYRLGLS
jgi:hypothetical protein